MKLDCLISLPSDYTENISLYFYVGETVQNGSLINAGKLAKQISNIIPNNSELIRSYGNPDYSAIITTSTAPAYGYFIVFTLAVQADTNVKFFINGIGVANLDWVTSNMSYRDGGWMFRCSKGDVFSYTTVRGNINRYHSKFRTIKTKCIIVLFY